MADKPIQHTPKHLEGSTFDPRHPAASSFAPLQPAAGVVADDVPERGQNLRGGPVAAQAHEQNLDQREVILAENEEKLQRAAGSSVAPTVVEGDVAKPAAGGGGGKAAGGGEKPAGGGAGGDKGGK